MEIINVKGEKYQYLLKTASTRFYISDLVFEVIKLMQEGKTNAEIATSLYQEQKIAIELTADDVASIKEEYIRPLGILDEAGSLMDEDTIEVPSDQARNHIYMKMTIMKKEQVAVFAKRLTFLFHAKFFHWILLSTIFLNIVLGIAYFQNIEKYVSIQDLSKIDGNSFLWYALLYYPTAIFVLLLHELGHSAPAYMYKTLPKSIGFGIYLIFPVLYADVTDAWELDRKKRLIINIGGIYIQLIINVFLLAIVPFVQEYALISSIVNALIGLNFLTIMLNLNPFFKFDGYWLYADFFRLPNLSKKAISYIRTLIYKNSTVAQEEIRGYNTIWLKLYSFLYLAFLVFILYLLIQGLILSVDSWKSVIDIINASDYTFKSIFKIVAVVITTMIISVILRLRIRNFYRYFLVKNQHKI